jgi:hypothetical protein
MITMDINPPRDTLGGSGDWTPVAYLAIGDPAIHEAVANELRQQGWMVIPHPTSFHLVRAIADVIEGGTSWLRPQMIVIDVWGRGCSGLTIACGLRDLGISTPIVLVRDQGDGAEPRQTLHDVEIVASADASRVVSERCRKLCPPARTFDPPS